MFAGITTEICVLLFRLKNSRQRWNISRSHKGFVFACPSVRRTCFPGKVYNFGMPWQELWELMGLLSINFVAAST